MRAKSVRALNTELCLAPDAVLPNPLPSSCVASQITMGEAEALRLHIFPADSDSLTPVFTALAEEMQPHHGPGYPIIMLGDEGQAHLGVRTKSHGVEFLICDPLVTAYGLFKLSQPVSLEKHRVRAVLSAAARFFWHLHRAPAERLLHQRVQVSVHKVKVDESGALDANLLQPFIADSGSLICSGAVEIFADNKTAYGMTVLNGFNAPLCVWAFYFDCSDLSIGERADHAHLIKLLIVYRGVL